MSVLCIIQSTVGGFATFAGFGLGVTAAKRRRLPPERTGPNWTHYRAFECRGDRRPLGGFIEAVWQSEESSAGIVDPILFSNHNADPDNPGRVDVHPRKGLTLLT